MRMLNVQWAMDNAIFNDLHDGESKWDMFAEKLDHVSWEFVASIEANGIVAGVVYEFTSNTFYNGHHRFLIAYLLGIKEIPVFEAEVDEFDSSDISCEMNGWPAAREGNI